MHPQGRPPCVADVDEVGRLGVVHLDASVEVAGERRCEQRLELAVPGPPVEPARDQDRLARRRDAEPFELLDRGGERVAPRVTGRAGQRQLRSLDEEGGGAAARDERLERRAGEREAERVANGRGDVDDALRGPARPQHDAVVACVHDRDARSGRDRDPRHYGMCRYSRRNVSRKPRCGQKREASRFVTRQSSHDGVEAGRARAQ